MDKEKIRKKILEILNDKNYKTTGILNKNLMKKLSIRERTTPGEHYYHTLDELEEVNKIARYKNAVRNETLLFLPEYKEDVFIEWNLHEKRTMREIQNIQCGFALIEQGVITQRKGGLLQFVGYYPLYDWSHTGDLDDLVNVEDNSDFMYLIIKNNNSYPIDRIKTSIELPRLFYEPGECKTKNCECERDRYTIFITSNSLIPKEKATVLISLLLTKHNVSFKDKKIEEKYRKDEGVPSVKCWYNNMEVPLKAGKGTLDTTKGDLFYIMKDEVLTFEFDE